MIITIIVGVILLVVLIIMVSSNKKKTTSLQLESIDNALEDNSQKGMVDIKKYQQDDIYSKLLYYVNIDGRTYGPFNLSQLKSYPLLENTLITTNTLNGVWYEAKYFECLDEVLNPNKDLPYFINDKGEIIRNNNNVL